MSIIPEPKCSLYMYEDDSLRVFVNQLTKEITFSISDVAEVLGYPDQKRMTRCLDDSECKTVTLQSKQQYKYHVQVMTFLGLAHAILNRCMPELNTPKEQQLARYFFNWVLHDVVPRELGTSYE